ncbi:hypothetical protein QYE76_032907 [Lolium multiflorum]|uniref:Reverse transcriptase zinc-binding domain-containing protein n=1 Tax=Lolium multiflorum TaxID=4521 RepID=A0AAD8QWG6_LOLMU|nr:hypothetical protein QYE76_032907 [Lolium multiflorum]
MFVDPSDERLMAEALGCPISSFPQPYLGLPLSPTKLPISAYAPLIMSFDRRLSGWQALLLSSGGRDLGDTTASPSFLDRIVAECLPLYRAVTRATVVSGTSTALWLDKWLPGKPLAERYPAIFSHVTRPHASVEQVISVGFSLQPRLTTAAERDLVEVQGIVRDTTLSDGQDLRRIDSPAAPLFSTREAYHLLSPSQPRDASACISWGLRLPSKVRIFSYLADINRLSTRANLFAKNCATSAIYAACHLPETGRHLFFDCALAGEVWDRMGTTIPERSFSLWELQPPAGVMTHIWHSGLATILWSLWKARNDLVFNAKSSTVSVVLR